MTTANCSGRPMRAQNVSRWLRVSMVEPDFDDARNSVASSGHSWPMRATAAGSVVSSTRSSGRPPDGGKVRARTSGKRLEPPMPMTTTWVRPSAAAVVGERVEPLAVGQHLGGHVEPPEPVGHLGGVVLPDRVVARPDPLDDLAGRRDRRRWPRPQPCSGPSCSMGAFYPGAVVPTPAAAATTSAAASPAASTMASITASSWARPGNATS